MIEVGKSYKFKDWPGVEFGTVIGKGDSWFGPEWFVVEIYPALVDPTSGESYVRTRIYTEEGKAFDNMTFFGIDFDMILHPAE